MVTLGSYINNLFKIRYVYRKMNITDEKSLIAFRAICNFVNDLAEEYGKRHKPLLLYKRLANHTQISHDKAIKKHNSIFTEFCTDNREALTTQDSSKLVNKRLSYSDRVFIDMEFIFRVSDAETAPVIWQHLLTISALLDPSGNAKNILRKQAEDGKSGGDEAKFINDIISKVQTHIKPDSSPMESITNILKSGVAQEVVGGIKGRLQSGKMDFGKMMGSIKDVISNFESTADPNSESTKSLHMVSSFLGSMSGDGSNPPDMGALMQMAMSLMTNMGDDDGSGSGGGAPSMSDMMSLMQTFAAVSSDPATDSQLSLPPP
jgi:hypothetical protein